MLVTTVFCDSIQTKTLPYEVWDAEGLLKSFKILKVVDSSGSIAGHERAFKVGICFAVQCYLGKSYNSCLFNQLFVTSSNVEGRTYTYLVCSSSLLPTLAAINGLPLEIKAGTQALKASDTKIYLEEEQADSCLSLAPEASGVEKSVKAQKAFQELFSVLPDGLKLGDICVLTSAYTLMAKIEENPERLKAAQAAVSLAKTTGDLNLYHKALAAASGISGYPNLSEIRGELAQIEQVRQLMAQEITSQVATGARSLDEDSPSAAARPRSGPRPRPSSWLDGTPVRTPVYEPTGCFSRNASPAQVASSGSVTPCMYLGKNPSRNALDEDAGVTMVFSVNQPNLQNATPSHSPVLRTPLVPPRVLSR